MLKLNVFKMLLKRVTVWTIVGSFLPHPLVISNAQAQQQMQGNAAMQTINTLGRSMQQSMRMQQEQMQMAKQRQMLRGLQNQRLKNLAGVPAPFRRCILPPTKDRFPKFACKENHPKFESLYLELRNIADANVDYYDRMLSTAKHEGPGQTGMTGLQCLDDVRTQLDKERENLVNFLQGIKDQMKQKNAQLQIDLEKYRKEMESVGAELYGAQAVGAGNTQKANANFDALFPGECQDILGIDAFNSAPKNGGLMAINNTFKKPAKKAFNYAREEKKVTKKLEKVYKRIRKNSMANLFDLKNIFGTNGRLNNVPAIQERVQSTLGVLQQEHQKANAALAETGYQLPNLDSQHFHKDLKNYKKTAKRMLQARFVHSCMNSGQSSVNLQDIISNLKQEGTNNSSTATNSYRDELNQILSTPSITFAQKVKLIRVLDNKYGGVKVRYRLGSRKGNFYVSQILEPALKNCESLYTQEPTQDVSISGGGEIARAKAVENQRAVDDAINRIEKATANFKENMISDIQNEVVNCGGEEMSPGQCTTSGELFNTSQKGFCMAHARTCADQTKTCAARAKKHVADREAVMKIKAKEFNAFYTAKVNEYNTFLNQQKAMLANVVAQSSTMLKGVKFKMPKDMFITPPKPTDHPGFKVSMMGGGKAFDMKELMSAPDKINNLIREANGGTFAQSVKQAAANYIAGQANAMKEDQKKWSELRNQCDQRHAAIKQGREDAINQQAQAINDANAQKMAKGQEFCSKLQGAKRYAKSNPLAACGIISQLAEDSVSPIYHGQLDPSALDLVAEWDATCQQSQAEREVGSEDNSYPHEIFSECNNWGDYRDDLLGDLVESIPQGEEFEESLAEHVENYVTSGGAESKDALAVLKKRDRAFYNRIRSFASLYKEDGVNVDPMEQFAEVFPDNSAVSDACKQFEDSKKEDCIAKASQYADGSPIEKAKVLEEMSLQNYIGEVKGIPTSRELSSISSFVQNRSPASGGGNNLCKSMKNETVAYAISECSESSYSQTCLEKKLKEFKSNPQGVARDIASVYQAATRSQILSSLGEHSSGGGTCFFSQNAMPRVDPLEQNILGGSLEDFMRNASLGTLK